MPVEEEAAARQGVPVEATAAAVGRAVLAVAQG